MEKIAKVSSIISEVTAASIEQSQGIEQVNVAVAEMDKVTQQNAANSEESAAASEELSGQAESLNGMVGELKSLVDGSDSNNHNENSQRVHTLVHHGNVMSKRKCTGSENKLTHVSKSSNAAIASSSTEKSPEKLIPFDDDSDLKDF